MTKTSGQLGKSLPLVPQTSSNPQYEGIDLFKAFFAICVVTVHSLNTHLENVFAWYLAEHLVFRVSVPFFFIASGFFLGKKIRRTPEKHREICLKRGKSLLMYYLFWGTLNSIIRMLMDLKSGTDFLDAFLQLLHKMVMTVPPIMWYLGSLFTATYLLALVRTKKSLLITMWIGIFLFALGLPMENYSGLFAGTALEGIILGYQKIFLTTNNVIFVGYAFVAAGVWLGKYANLDTVFSLKAWIVLAAGVVLGIMETWILWKWVPDSMMNRHGFLLMSLPIAYGLFSLVCNPHIHFRLHSHYLRVLANYFYFAHSAVLASVLYLTDIPIYYVYLVVMAVLFVTSVIVYKWNNRFINKLFGF